MSDLATVTGKRYVYGANGVAQIRDVAYIASPQSADGFVYFNDDVMWRCDKDGNNLQRFYFNKEIWVRTEDITDINVTGFNTSGGTPLPPGGQGIEDAVLWAIDIANDNTHGYDQPTRDGGVDFDCSSLTSWAFRVGGGFNIPSPSPSTYTMRSAFESAGFTWYPGLANDSSQLYRGDILLFIGDPNAGTGHVAIYIGDGQLVEACINEFGGISGGESGDQTGAEIRVAGYYYGNWDGVLRYVG